MRVLVTGAGGFIGHHLVRRLKREGNWVKGVDLTYPKFERSDADEFDITDLRISKAALNATATIDHVYALAADMGGMGYISSHQSEIFQNNLQINLNTIDAAVKSKCTKIFFSSSACVYPEFLQEQVSLKPLKESDAYPAMPQEAYGWEKLTTERLFRCNAKDHGISTCIARFHNVYGPLGTWEGGREKAPAAICRKVANAKIQSLDTITIWGDGTQTRSFCYIDDCVDGILKLMKSGYEEPVNLGSDQLVSINELVEIISSLAGHRVLSIFDLEGPQGVRGRNSDNTLLQEITGWKPSTSLSEGLLNTYQWIEEQVKRKQESI